MHGVLSFSEANSFYKTSKMVSIVLRITCINGFLGKVDNLVNTVYSQFKDCLVLHGVTSSMEIKETYLKIYFALLGIGWNTGANPLLSSPL